MNEQHKFNYLNNQDINLLKQKEHNIIKRVSTTNIGVKAKSNYSVLKSTVILLSWLFMLVIGVVVLCFTNENNNKILLNNNNLIAEGLNTFADVATRQGDGSADSPYQISTMADLEFLSNEENSGYWGKCFIQTQNIPYSSSSWNPIGNSTTQFTGNYDGAGYTIKLSSNLSSSSSIDSSLYAGLFGCTSGATIKNLGVEWQLDEIDCDSFGGVVGNASKSNIINCYSKGAVNNVFKHSYNDVYTGGIVGYSDNSSIENCYNESEIISKHSFYDNRAYAGGIVGYAENSSSITNCYNKNKISAFTGERTRYAGGITGEGGNISKCYNLGTIIAGNNSSTDDLRGGISAEGAVITDCFYLASCVNSNSNSDGVSCDETTLKSTLGNTLDFYNFETNQSGVWKIDSNHNSGYPYLITIEEYSITYKAGDGTGNDVLKYYGLKTTLPQVTLPNVTSTEIGFTAPSGKLFNCWMDESGYKYYLDNEPSITLKSNLVLTAQWKLLYKDFTINLNANGGTNGSVTQLQVVQSVPQKTQLSGGELPTRNGYTFKGFYMQTTGGEEYINSNGAVVTEQNKYLTEISTLYAQWQPINYTITYYIVKDGVVSTWSDSGNPASYNIETNTITVNTPTNVGNQYNYKGWSTTQGGATSTNTLTIPKGSTGNLIYYFVYETKKLTLTLNCTNYSNQNYFVYVYKDGQMKYQLYVQGNATINLDFIDGYKAGQYSIRFVTSYLSNVKVAENGADNITLNGKEIQIDTFKNTTINYTLSSYNGNNSIVI